MATYMKMPFTLEKPSENEWAVEAKDILYVGEDGDKSVQEAIDELETGGGSSNLPLDIYQDSPNSLYSKGEPNYLGFIESGKNNSILLGAGGYAAGDRILSFNTGTLSLTYTINGNDLRITRFQDYYVYQLQDYLKDADFKRFIDNIVCRLNTDLTKKFDITLTFKSVTRGTSNTTSYITATPSVTIPASRPGLQYTSKLTQRTVSLGQSNYNSTTKQTNLVGWNNTELANTTTGGYNTLIGTSNINTKSDTNGGNTIIGKKNILVDSEPSDTNAAFILGTNNVKTGSGTVIGRNNISGQYGYALGIDNKSENGGFLFGASNEGSNNNYLFGSSNKIDSNKSDYNYAIGELNKIKLSTTDTKNEQDYIFGRNNTATGNNNMVIGYNNNVNGLKNESSVVIGVNTTTDNTDQNSDIIIANNTNKISIGDKVLVNGNEIPSNEKIIELEEKIDQIELVKYPNVTIFGNPTIQSGQISDFGVFNYLQFPFLVDFKDRPFEINMCFTTGNNVTSQENIFDSNYGLAFAVRNGKFVIALSSDGSSWDIGEHIGSQTVTPNTTYYVKLYWDSNDYKLEVSTDKINYINDITVNSSASLYPKQIIIGRSPGNHFSGSVNLNYCNLSIMGQEVWQGMDEVGLATRLATDLSNIDDAGRQAIVNTAFDYNTFDYTAFKREYDENGNIDFVELMTDERTISKGYNGLEVMYDDLTLSNGENGLYVNEQFLARDIEGYDDDDNWKERRVSNIKATVDTIYKEDDDGNKYPADEYRITVDTEKITGKLYNESVDEEERIPTGLESYNIYHDDGYYVDNYDIIKVKTNDTLTLTDDNTMYGGGVGINFDNNATTQELEFELEDGTIETFKFIAKRV